MARVQFVVPDEDRDRLVAQARREGLTLSAWLRDAARDRLARRRGFRRFRPFESDEELEAFFRACDAIAGPEREPDWEEHLAVMNASRMRGASGT